MTPGRCVRAVGTMVGTSLDGVDAALVEFADTDSLRPVTVLGFRTVALQDAPALRLREVAADASCTASELSALGFAVAADHERAVRAVCAEAGQEVAELGWVGAHGVTVAHQPGRRGGHGWQLLAAGALAARLRCPVVSDFRSADIALGGEGAPLAPVADLHLRVGEDEDRVVLNLGGVANLSALPAGARRPREVVAADVGPANLPLDELVRRHATDGSTFDRDGNRAAAGRVQPEVVRAVLAEDWVRAPLPRSFGREEFGPSWVDRFEARTAGLSLEDRLATLVEIEARAVAHVLREEAGPWMRRAPDALRVLLTGGGRHNRALERALARALAPARVDGIEVLGEDADAKEAVDFALLGGLRLRHRAAGAAATTGATRDTVLGAVHDPRART